MSIKPSNALLALYKKDCYAACKQYSYWWSYKAAAMSSQRWDLQLCVQKCVNDTIKNENPTFCNEEIKKSDTEIARVK